MQLEISAETKQLGSLGGANEHGDVELSIVMPCLNETETLPAATLKAQSSLKTLNLTDGDEWPDIC